MGCGCRGGNKRAGLRGTGNRPVTTPRAGALVTPRTLGPTAKRQLSASMRPSQTTAPYSAQRREIERKRRLAVMKALGR